MIHNYKFLSGFQGYLGIMNGQTYASASFYDPHILTEDERLTRINERIRIDEQMRNHGRISHEQYMLNRDMMIEQERIRRLAIVNHSRETDNRIRLYQATRVTTVNPTFKTKVKIFGTQVKLMFKSLWQLEPVGVVMVILLASLITFIGITKLFGR